MIRVPLIGKLIVDEHDAYGTTVAHSPKVWPWWKLWKLQWVRTNPDLPRIDGVHSFNVWLYTRNNARCTYVCFDFRKEPT